MALKFRSAPQERIYTADEFLGVDFTCEPSKLATNRSPDAKNMIINKNGYVEKRTGYRRVFEGVGNVNGMFEYICPQNYTTYNFIHIGTDLYKFSFGQDGEIVLGDKILSGLKDKKSRAFTFGSSLYILGAGYIKIGYDEFTKNICYGFVNKSSSIHDEDNAPLVLSGRSKDGKTYGEGSEYECSNSYKKIRFSYDTYSFYNNDKMYVAPPEYENKVRVASVYFPDGNGGYARVREFNYTVSSDAKGLYIELTRQNYEVEKYYNCSPYVIVQYDSFVYVPTTVTGRSCIGENEYGYVVDKNGERYEPFAVYNGNVLEAANLASRLRKVEFSVSFGDYIWPMYRFYIGPYKATRIWVNGGLVHKYRDLENKEVVMQSSNADWVDISRSIIRYSGTVTIEYIMDGDFDVIDNCDIYALYGGSNDTRAFVSGNEKYPARDFASGLFDGTYFSDLMYTDVGAEESAIIGYHKLYGNLIIVKDGVGKDSAQYLRSFSLTTDDSGNTTAVFTVKQGTASYGALNKSSFKNIGGVPLYLGQDGVFAIRATNVENQNNTTCVSQRVNGRLTKEQKLENAVCASVGGKYYIFLDTRAYVCAGENGFEWFYFDSLPDVKCVWVYNNNIYFGSDDGVVYRFMTEDEPKAYYDNVALDGSTQNARAIEAVWEIASTTLGEYANYKTVRNCYITCMPHRRSGVKVYYNTNEDYRDWVLAENIDLFSFDGVDFDRFTFRTIQAPFVFATGVKVKNIYVFGVRLVNDAPGEPFGFLAVSVKYRSGKYVK